MPETITIPQKLTQEGDLVVIPRKTYEELLAFRKHKEVKLTATQKKALLKAERNFQSGQTLSLDEFRKKLGFAN